MDAIENSKMNAINAGPADFFREVKATSMAMNLIYYNLIKGKKAQWLCDAKKVHIMSYTPDLAKGTAIFGTTPVAYNQIWNLPTDSKKITGEGWVSLFAKEMKVSNKYQVMPNWLLKNFRLLYSNYQGITGDELPICQELFF